MRLATPEDVPGFVSLLNAEGAGEEGAAINEQWGCMALLTAIVLVGEGACFIANPLNATTCVLHPCVAKEQRGRSDDLMGETLAILTSSPYRKAVGFVPAYSPNVLRYFLRNGFKQEGTLTNSIAKGGELHNQALVAIDL